MKNENLNITVDHKLLSGFRQGREESFTLIFRLLYKALCYYAIKKIDDQSIAEDIVQEAFIRVWHRREQFQTWLSLRHYLYVTVRNLSFDYLRKGEVVRKAKPDIIGLIDIERSKIEDIIRAETLRELHLAIAELAPQCQAVVKLLFLDERTPKEVADELGININTVRVQKMRGLEILKKRLKLLVALLFIVSLIYLYA